MRIYACMQSKSSICDPFPWIHILLLAYPTRNVLTEVIQGLPSRTFNRKSVVSVNWNFYITSKPIKVIKPSASQKVISLEPNTIGIMLFHRALYQSVINGMEIIPKVSIKIKSLKVFTGSIYGNKYGSAMIANISKTKDETITNALFIFFI